MRQLKVTFEQRNFSTLIRNLVISRNCLNAWNFFRGAKYIVIRIFYVYAHLSIVRDQSFTGAKVLQMVVSQDSRFQCLPIGKAGKSCEASKPNFWCL